MKPNYKALAERYRKDYEKACEMLIQRVESCISDREIIQAKDREIDELKRKYTEAMNRLIELQELIARKEGQGVEVVRCKDCKHLTLIDEVVICSRIEYHSEDVDLDHFCSYGERREK